MKNKTIKNKQPRLFAPKYWGSWLLAGLLWLLVRVLPYHWLMSLGSGLGRLMEKLMPYRSLVAKTNIRLCFENSDKDWQTIYQRYVRSLGKGVFEMAMAWFLPPNHFADKVTHVGYEAAEKALADGRGILFLGVHTTGLDFGAPLLNSRYPTLPMYKAARNPVLDYLIVRSRLRNCPGVIEQDNLREVFRRLKKGDCIWYGCDQDFGRWSKSVFAPFFGVSAWTLPYYAKIAEKTQAAVIPVAGFRDDKSGRFIVKYLPEIPVNNVGEKAAAIAMNQAIEQIITGYEDQYYWVHRRFKTRPDGQADVYPPKPSHLRRQRREAKKAQKEKQ